MSQNYNKSVVLMKMFSRVRLIIIFLFCGEFCFSQTSKIRIVNSDLFETFNQGSERIKKLSGNVVLEHDNTRLNCDSAYLYDMQNYVEAFGHVLINHADSVSFTGDRLKYYGKNKTAKLEKNVNVNGENFTLYSDELEYDLDKGRASFYTGGKVVSGTNEIKSKIGYYITNKKLMIFSKNVELNGDNSKLISDSLVYNTSTKGAYFLGKSVIISSTDTATCDAGNYSTVEQSGLLKFNVKIKSNELKIASDSVYFNRNKQYTKPLGNVVIYNFKDSVWICGNRAETWGNERAYITDNAYFLSVKSNDTTMIAGDTISAYKVKDRMNIKFIRNVKVISSSLRAICDSLVYSKGDSLILMYKGPALWSDLNQITGDTIIFKLSNNQIDSMFVLTNAFVISKEGKEHFNQIKGRILKAKFTKGKINLIRISGNSQSIYYAKEDSLYLGVNVVDCSEMQFDFLDGKIKNASFITRPEATFLPINDLKPEELKLKGFLWKYHLKPKGLPNKVRNIKIPF